MPKTPIPLRSNDRISPKTTLVNLANNSLLDALTGPQLVVYLRLLRAVAEQRSRSVQIINSLLYRDARTAARALRELEDMGLIKVEQGARPLDRKIEVSR
jgi:predicted transcriptional regulator